jgi:protein gp37
MASKTKIEWADATWTPLQARRRDTGKTGVHCVKVSEECKNCYSERHNQRSLPAHGTGLPFTVLSTEKVEMFLNPDILEHPLRWKRPRTIFVCSQTDLFGEFVPDELIDRVFTVMALCPQHRFLVLTKRAERMHQYCSSNENAMLMAGVLGLAVAGIKGSKLTHTHVDDGLTGFSLQNVWLGVTAGTQKTANERIPWLLKTPAAERFLSAEPLLEALDLTNILWHGDHYNSVDALRGGINHPLHGVIKQPIGKLGWVVTGGESGPGARPMHPDWARSLRDQCVAAGVPFHFKQWGEWQNGSGLNPANDRVVLNDGMVLGVDLQHVEYEVRTNWNSYRSTMMSRVGKKAAGRLLDGREWNEVPNA